MCWNGEDDMVNKITSSTFIIQSSNVKNYLQTDCFKTQTGKLISPTEGG